VAVCFFISLFLALTAFRLDVPGIHGDEISFSPLLTWMEGRFWGVLSSYHGVSESFLIAVPSVPGTIPCAAAPTPIRMPGNYRIFAISSCESARPYSRKSLMLPQR
jgi:hypothetical protein